MRVRTTIYEKRRGMGKVMCFPRILQSSTSFIRRPFSHRFCAMKTTFATIWDFSFFLLGSNEGKGFRYQDCSEYIKISAEMQLGDRQIKKSCNASPGRCLEIARKFIRVIGWFAFLFFPRPPPWRRRVSWKCRHVSCSPVWSANYLPRDFAVSNLLRRPQKIV